MNYFERKTLAELKRTIRPRAAWADIEADAKRHAELLGLHSHRPGRVLEIGCGIGRMLRWLSDNGWDAHGIDNSESMIAAARDYAPHSSVAKCLGDGSIPVDGPFDVVFSIITFQHIPRTEIVLHYIGEAVRVLKPGGTLVFQLLTQSKRRGPLWTVHSGAAVASKLRDLGMHCTTRDWEWWRIYDCQ